MAGMKRMALVLCVAMIGFIYGTAYAVTPDFNADRRVNVKCPCSLHKNMEGRFEKDGFMQTLRRLYNDLDMNLWASARKSVKGEYGEGYTFSEDPNQGIFYVCHAKAFFAYASLESLNPQDKIRFQEVFYITEVDWDSQELKLVRQRDHRMFTINVNDFDKAFLWYNALLDKQRAYIPVYGFLSLPGEARTFPTIWNSWEENRADTATPPESLVDYDFYKVLDYRNGYYLLAKDYNEFDYRNNIEDFGLIGWVREKYITIWRSRLYYHPVIRVSFFNNPGETMPAVETAEINRFYVDHTYLKERLFNDIVERLDQESLHNFYTHFGFPQLNRPESFKGHDYAKVFIPGAFTPRLMRLLGNSIKKNLNTFFLIDVSESMRPFADYVRSFNKSVQDMREKGIGLRMNRIYAYWDSVKSDRDVKAQPNFVRVKTPEDLDFGKETGDHNYTEPLLRAILKTMGRIESLQNQRLILPLQEKLLFIITDAGANDESKIKLSEIAKKAKKLNLRVYFICPDTHGVKMPSSSLDDTPANAYQNLMKIVAYFDGGSGKQSANFRKFEFQSEKLLSVKERRADFLKQHKRLLDGIKTYINHVFKIENVKKLPKDIFLYFSDEALLEKMRKWSDRKIQVLNHVVKYIKDVDQPAFWEERIAIPAKPVESYLRAIRTQDDVSLADLKKLVIINSLVSVDDVEKCRKLYDNIKPLIEKKTFQSADSAFYKALTNREPGKKTSWNRALGENKDLLGKYLSKRGFHLNSFNQAVQRKFMYLKIDELYGNKK